MKFPDEVLALRHKQVAIVLLSMVCACSDGDQRPAPAATSKTPAPTQVAPDAAAETSKKVFRREETPKNAKPGELVSVREFYENGQLYTERTERVVGERQRVRIGAMRAWWENGKPRLEGGYDDEGRLAGRWRYYYESGALEREGDFVAGKHSGDWTESWPNGKRRFEGFYHLGMREGFWRTWHENGARESEGEYVNNLRTGEWKFWLPSGGVDAAQSGEYVANVRTE